MPTLYDLHDSVRCTTLQFLLYAMNQEALRPFALPLVDEVKHIVRADGGESGVGRKLFTGV